MPRVPLLSLQDPSAQVQALYEAVRQVGYAVPSVTERQQGKHRDKLPQMWRALAHSPEVGKWVAAGSKLFFSESEWTTNNLKLRQLLILTICKRWDCDLVFRWHANLAESYGVAREKIDILLDDIARAKTSSVFDEEEQLLISFADEMTTTGQAPARLFRDVLQRYGTKSTIEIAAFAAFYLSVVSLCNVLEVEDD